MPAFMTDTAEFAEPVTPSDDAGAGFSRPARFLYVGTGGTVAVVLRYGGVVVNFVVPAGAILPVQAVRVNATDTTAADIVAMW